MLRDLGVILRRKAARAYGDDHSCSVCRRVPLAGELVYELSSHPRVCQLCLPRVPDSNLETIGSERVHASIRPIPVAPRAA
jgi:hypothetical protein